jgi:hypothetical protein
MAEEIEKGCEIARQKIKEKKHSKTVQPTMLPVKAEITKLESINLLKNNALDDDDIFADVGKLDFSASAQVSGKYELDEVLPKREDVSREKIEDGGVNVKDDDMEVRC